MVNYGPVMDEVDIMFPEGYNCAQIFALLEEKGVCTVADLEAYAAEGELSDYWFLEGVERGHKYCLEGYLAPDTYTFYTNDEPGRVLEKFLAEFDDRFTDKMKEDFATMQQRYNQALSDNGYGNEYIANNPLTLHKLVTLASIVQKETANDAESYNIASVFYNRLTDPASHPYLGSDATVYYAIGDYFGEKGELSQEELTFDKGCDKVVEQYSGFEGMNNAEQSLGEILELLDTTDVYVCGIATEYCVKNTCADLHKAGFKVHVLSKCLAYVGHEGHLEALKEMKEMGMQVE
jgi:hypothetical protein